MKSIIDIRNTNLKKKRKHKPKIKGRGIFGQTLKNFESLWYRSAGGR